MGEQAFEVVDAVAHGRELAGEGFRLGFHRPVETAAFFRCRSERVSDHVRADRALGHLLFQLADGLARLAGDLLQRVQPGVDHLVEVLACQLARRGHLGERQRQ